MSKYYADVNYQRSQANEEVLDLSSRRNSVEIIAPNPSNDWQNRPSTSAVSAISPPLYPSPPSTSQESSPAPTRDSISPEVIVPQEQRVIVADQRPHYVLNENALQPNSLGMMRYLSRNIPDPMAMAIPTIMRPIHDPRSLTQSMVMARDGRQGRPFKAEAHEILRLLPSVYQPAEAFNQNGVHFKSLRKRVMNEVTVTTVTTNPKMRRTYKPTSTTSDDSLVQPSTSAAANVSQPPGQHEGQHGQELVPAANGNGNASGDQVVRDEAYYEKRKKNNEAAKKSRDRRRIKEDEISIKAAYLEHVNKQAMFELNLAREILARLQFNFPEYLKNLARIYPEEMNAFSLPQHSTFLLQDINEIYQQPQAPQQDYSQEHPQSHPQGDQQNHPQGHQHEHPRSQH